MPFLARCPDCELGFRAADKDVGRIVACHGCRCAYVIERDPSDEPVELTAPAADTLPMRAERTQPSPVAVLDPAAGSGVVESLPIIVEYSPKPIARPNEFADEDRCDTAGPGPGLWVLAGIACFCAVGAGLSSSITSLCFLVIPLAIVGLLLGGTGVLFFFALGAVRLELALPGIPTAGSLLVLWRLALFAPDYLSPQYEASRKKPEYDADAVRYMPKHGELIDPATLVPVEGWADARKMACLQGTVQIEVASAAIGPIELSGGKPAATKERYLAITLQIHHLGHGKAVPFAAWGSTVPRPVPDAKMTAGGKAVGLAPMGARAVSGMLYNGLELTPASTASTKLIFDLPPPGEAPLRLELPAEAWGGRGSFKFSIPASMISGATGPKAK